MRLKSVPVWSALALLVATAACEKASPTRPSDVDSASAAAETVTDARTGVTIVAARPAAPVANAQIPFAQQPITLSVANGVSTGSSGLTYIFEVATDPGFTQRAFARDNVPPGDGTTSVAVDRLAGARTYYWRVQSNSASGSGGGPYSAVRSFTIGPEVILGTPVLSSPINGASAFSPLTLTINNIPRSGPAGAISYHVEVASNDAFGNVIFATDAAEQGGAQTTVTAAVSGLSDGGTYFWRARATDTGNNIVTPYSSAGSFRAQSFNIQTAKFWDNPADAGTWPVGTRITYIEFTGSSMRVDFDRRDGADRWPDVVPPGWVGALQYTLGLCRFIGGTWNCSAVVQFWHGRSLDDTAPPSRFWREWWYDGARWGPLADLQGPAEGELIGVFVAAGDLRQRQFSRASCPRVCEISNIAMVPFTTGYAKYEF
jgi:hypothetical protein